MNIDKIVSDLGLPEQLQVGLREAWDVAVQQNKEQALAEAKKGDVRKAYC